MNEKQRAAFEKWASQHEYDLTWSDAIDCYAIMRTRVVFDAWQAAIASLVVELPFEDGGGVELQKGFNLAVSQLKDSLNKAGVRYE